MYNDFNYPYAAGSFNAASQQAQPQYYTRSPQGLKGRPVTSLEEARVTNIDFDGSLFIFPDIVNKKIYTKQINIDGTALFNVYELSEKPIEEKKNEYVTKEELEQAVSDIVSKTLAAQTQAQKKTNINF